jgi:hypothetical protein
MGPVCCRVETGEQCNKISRNALDFDEERFREQFSTHIFPPNGRQLRRPAVPFVTDTVRNETEMLKKIITDFRAAVMLIATENLSVLRGLLKKLITLTSKSFRAQRKT